MGSRAAGTSPRTQRSTTPTETGMLTRNLILENKLNRIPRFSSPFLPLFCLSASTCREAFSSCRIGCADPKSLLEQCFEPDRSMDMRLVIGRAHKSTFTEDRGAYNVQDVVMVPDCFCEEDETQLYNTLLQELRDACPEGGPQAGLHLQKGRDGLWTTWSGACPVPFVLEGIFFRFRASKLLPCTRL